jgi:hypothetical protein
MLLLYVEDNAKGLVSYSSFFTTDLVVSDAPKKTAEISLFYSLNFDRYSSFPNATV